ncbi:hypothetical protein I3259_02685 [Photobacterium sp. Ph5]|nr:MULTISPECIES: hypothetical protein [unclassified Photobacterium]MCG3862926.1 hypothetical protein [Photobacterium sp. Ph6]MCG3874457.1 hypothetical protein [Photobacterium sp. Ph5]
MQLLKVKQEYESQIHQCQLLENRKLKPINDPWLNSLSLERKKIILNELNNAALQRCVIKKEKDFTYNLLDYTAKTGDKLFLNSWLIFKSALYGEKYNLVLTEKEQRNINRLMGMPKYYYPFDIKSVSYV